MADDRFAAAILSILSGLIPLHLQKPRVGIVCGSGLGGLVSTLRDTVEVPYDQLEGFVNSTSVYLELSFLEMS
jgi:purine-nucleoside phosphorylase